MRITVEGSCERSCRAERGTLEIEVRGEAPAAEAEAAMQRAVARAREIDADLAARGAAEHTLASPVTTIIDRGEGDGSATEPHPARRLARVSIALSLTAQDPALLGAVALRWGAAPDVVLTGVRWELSEATRLRMEAEALRDALADARRRLDVLAAGAEAAEVRIVEIEDRGTSTPGPYLMRASMGGDAESELAIDPELVTVTGAVRVVAEA